MNDKNELPNFWKKPREERLLTSAKTSGTSVPKQASCQGAMKGFLPWQ